MTIIDVVKSGNWSCSPQPTRPAVRPHRQKTRHVISRVCTPRRWRRERPREKQEGGGRERGPIERCDKERERDQREGEREERERKRERRKEPWGLWNVKIPGGRESNRSEEREEGKLEKRERRREGGGDRGRGRGGEGGGGRRCSRARAPFQARHYHFAFPSSQQGRSFYQPARNHRVSGDCVAS